MQHPHHSLGRIAKNTLLGLEMAPWLLIGGLLLSLTIYGAIIGVPMFLLGLLIPFIEAYLGYTDHDWSGQATSEENPKEPDEG